MGRRGSGGIPITLRAPRVQAWSRQGPVRRFRTPPTQGRAAPLRSRARSRAEGVTVRLHQVYGFGMVGRAADILLGCGQDCRHDIDHEQCDHNRRKTM